MPDGRSIGGSDRETPQAVRSMGGGRHALDPLREGSHALLVRASAAAGNAGGVPRLLRACRQALAAEGLHASPTLERLAADLARRTT